MQGSFYRLKQHELLRTHVHPSHIQWTHELVSTNKYRCAPRASERSFAALGASVVYFLANPTAVLAPSDSAPSLQHSDTLSLGATKAAGLAIERSPLFCLLILNLFLLFACTTYLSAN